MEKMLVLSFLGGQDGPKMSNFKSSCYCNFMEKNQKSSIRWLLEPLLIIFKPTCYCNLKVTKNQKSSDCHFFIKPQKPHFGPILVLFGPKTSREDFSLNIHLGKFKTKCHCNLIQKTRKIPRVDFSKNLKNLTFDNSDH